MNCGKCGGKVFLDDAYSRRAHIEVYCVLCGKRWMISKIGNALGRWLEKKRLESSMGLSPTSIGTDAYTDDYR